MNMGTLTSCHHRNPKDNDLRGTAPSQEQHVRLRSYSSEGAHERDKIESTAKKRPTKTANGIIFSQTEVSACASSFLDFQDMVSQAKRGHPCGSLTLLEYTPMEANRRRPYESPRYHAAGQLHCVQVAYLPHVCTRGKTVYERRSGLRGPGRYDIPDYRHIEQRHNERQFSPR